MLQSFVLARSSEEVRKSDITKIYRKGVFHLDRTFLFSPIQRAACIEINENKR